MRKSFCSQPGWRAQTQSSTRMIHESRVRIVIDDTGQFVPISDRPNRGLGLLLTEKLSSELEITTSERGTRVALEKALPRATL